MSQELLAEVRDLADRHCAGLLSDEETARLNELLRDNPLAQRAFLETTSVYARLQWEFGGTRAKEPQPAHLSFLAEQPPVPAPHVRAQATAAGRWWKGILAASLVAACAILGLVAAMRNWPAPVIAILQNSVDARWHDDFSPADDVLSAGRLRLDEGLAEIEFGRGAVAVLKAPVDIELVTVDQVVLHSGQVLVRVPRDGRAAGFRVDTPSSRLVDLGTEFGVEVQTGGGSLLQVYEGEVLAATKFGPNANATRRVLEGEALLLGENLHVTEFWPERFVRTLPGPDDPSGRGRQPYNKSRFDSVYVVPAPGQVQIDGDLSDWNLSRQFRAACEPPYAKNYYLEPAMMYDDQRLYLAAHVGDPYPLRSQIAPTEPSTRHGMGGAVSLRISTDRRAGWPLAAESAKARQGRPLRPEDLNDKLTFIVLWYYEPEQLPCIHVRHGMDLHDMRVNPPGYEGAFRRDADGAGYTLEYAIPWIFLHAEDDPPRAGDELAAMWLAHWSDAAGRNWQGQLIEVMQPHEPGWNFDRAATWGKAIYLPAANAANE